MTSKIEQSVENVEIIKKLVDNVAKCKDDNQYLWVLDEWTLITSSSRAGLFMLQGDFGLNPAEHPTPAIYEEGIRELMQQFLGLRAQLVDFTEFKKVLSDARKAKGDIYPVGIRLGETEYAYDFKRLARLLSQIDLTGVRVAIMDDGPIYFDGGWWKLSLMRMVHDFLEMKETPRITLGPKPEPVDAMGLLEALSS